MAGKPSAKLSDYVEAAGWFRSRTPMQKPVWETLQGRAQRQAFTVAGVAQLSLIAEVQQALEKAIRKGTTLQTFKREMKKKLEAEWAGSVANPGARLENIFRTNVQMAYAQGRRAQMLEPAVLRFRPYWRYVATLDARTTVICQRLHNTILPATDRFWLSHTPPLHFQCRGTIQSLSRPQMLRKGGLTEERPKVPAQAGFGGTDAKPFQPDLSKFPANLVRVHEKKKKKEPALPHVPEPTKVQPPPQPVAPPARAAEPRLEPKHTRPPPAPVVEPELPTSTVRGEFGVTVEKHFPRIAKAFGEKLRVDDSDKWLRHVEDLNRLPDHVLNALGSYLHEVHLGKGSLFDLDASLDPEARKKGEASRYQRVAGGHYRKAKKVLVGDLQVGFTDSTALHELSHAWDESTGKVSATKTWTKAWEAWRQTDWAKRKLFRYITQEGKGATEAFAELGATYLMHGKDAVRAKFGDSDLVDLIEAAFKDRTK